MATNAQTLRIGKIELSHNGTETVRAFARADTPEEFDALLETAQDILRGFHSSGPGSMWGCDGIGYVVQRQKLLVDVKRSGIGPRVFARHARELAGA
jgi:hypothetical protein